MLTAGLVTAAEAPEALTWDDVEPSARDLIAVWLNALLDSFGVVVTKLDNGLHTV